MALTRLTIDGYGQVELNNVAFRRDGRIEAQCALDKTDFATVKAENGMLLAVDRINRTVRMPDTAEVCPIALNYSTEHIYDERTPGLKNFYLNGGDYPRMGYLSVGDLFTTNTLSYDAETDAGWTSDDAFKTAFNNLKTAKIYGTTAADGTILCSATAPATGVKLLAVEKTTMPDGSFGVKFQVLVA